MNRYFMGICFAAFSGSVAVGEPPASPLVPRYRLEVAGFHQGADFGLVTGMNDAGEAVYIQHSFGTRSYWWNGESVIQLPVGDTGFQAVGMDINNSSRIAGLLHSGVVSKAAIWDKGVLQQLGTLGGTNSRALAVNDAGTVAGWSETATGAKHLFTWNDGFQDHGPLPPSSTCCMDIRRITESGHVVGYASSALTHGWHWDGSQFIALRDLAGGIFATPRDISESGLVVGGSNVGQTNLQPVTWQNGQIVALPKPPSALGGTAYAVNSSDQIVGSVAMPGFVSEAVLWIGEQPYLLRDLVVGGVGDWQLWRSEAITDNGNILVFAYSNELGYRRVILTPVPEPGLPLLAAMALAIGCGARRRAVTRP